MCTSGVLFYKISGTGVSGRTDPDRSVSGGNREKEDTDDVKFKELPEIEAACIYHRGSYNEFSRSYAAVLRYIEENGYEICGDIREKYIDGVWNKDTEEEWLSEIQIPVKRAGGTDED